MCFGVMQPCDCGDADCGRPFWTVDAYPAKREIYGGHGDGSHIFPFFRFDLLKLYYLMDTVKYMDMNNGAAEFRPVIMIEGTIKKHRVGVCVMASPPGYAKPYERVNAATGEIVRCRQKH